jgi:hypothetical protein
MIGTTYRNNVYKLYHLRYDFKHGYWFFLFNKSGSIAKASSAVGPQAAFSTGSGGRVVAAGVVVGGSVVIAAEGVSCATMPPSTPGTALVSRLSMVESFVRVILSFARPSEIFESVEVSLSWAIALPADNKSPKTIEVTNKLNVFIIYPSEYLPFRMFIAHLLGYPLFLFQC